MTSTSATRPIARTRRTDCERIANEAAVLLRSRFGDPGEIRDKGVPDDRDRLYDVVTEVDNLSERLILGRIAEISSDAVVVAEEGGLTDTDGIRIDAEPADADELWLIDPLDGTVNFAHNVPHFCVSVACWSRGEPVAGAIVDPMVGETFSFEWVDEQNRAAFHDGQRIELGGGGPTDRSIIYVGGGGPALVPLLRRFRSWRRMGSAALALAWVGSGRCGAYVQPGMLHPWDWGVGAPFVLAAGGQVTDGSGMHWPARLEGTTGMIAAPTEIHDAIAEMAAAASASG